MSNLYIPKDYKPILGIKETENAIIALKDFFQLSLSTELSLTRVTAPLFVKSGTGINDDLNGIERPVKFNVKDLNEEQMEIVHSLAKWKRLKVSELNLHSGFGIYTDMNAIRCDEELDNVHSIYVDQWDWCLAMDPKNRTVMFLKEIVKKIYRCLKQTEFFVYDRYSEIEPILPDEITFIHSEDLLYYHPDLSPKERENLVCKKFGAVFIIGIGGKLQDGSIHDGRAPDYDDWITESGDGHRGLNGDLLVWNPVLNCAMELSSMGIRVNAESLRLQLQERGCPERENLPFHKLLLEGKLKQTIGGGIGESRLCMFFLRKAHIGETQVSVWPDEMLKTAREHKIAIL